MAMPVMVAVRILGTLRPSMPAMVAAPVVAVGAMMIPLPALVGPTLVAAPKVARGGVMLAVTDMIATPRTARA